MSRHPRPGRTRVKQVFALLIATCLTVLAISAVAVAKSTEPTATISSATVHNAVAARMAASRALKRNSKKLRACKQAHSGSCRAERRALKRSRKLLAGAERRVSLLTADTARSKGLFKQPSTGAKAPALTGAHSPTIIGKLPIVSSPPVSTPPVTSTPAPAPTPAPTTPSKSNVPALSVSGKTIAWSSVEGVKSYVFVRKVPGHSDQYSTIGTTSTTPTPVPGATVRYSVRTNVTGSEWAPEIAVTYGTGETGGSSQPSAPTEPVTPPVIAPETPTTPETGTGSGSGSSSNGNAGNGAAAGPFSMGVVAGSSLEYERPFLEKLGAHVARMEVTINTPASQIASTVEAYARAGIQPMLLAGFAGRIPSAAEVDNLANWAAEFGPGGTLWKGKSFPAGTAVTHIEFGNETSYTYQFSNNSTSEYASRAESYAVRAKEAAEAIDAVEPNVGLLAQGDSGGLSGNPWVLDMFKAVPNLGQFVSGWTVHPYGSEWNTKLDQLVSATAAVGAPSSIPIYVTEWGLDTDNGHCLEYNYGWNKCMSYEEAASTLSSSVSAMRSRYGSRLAAIFLYEAHDQKPTGTTTELEGYFGALQSNGAPKGAYTTEVQSLLSTNP
jgi:hypothetical protein